MAGCLLRVWRASSGLHCSACPFSAALGRCFMPGLLTSERLSAMCLVDLETFPILGQPVIRLFSLRRVGWFCMTTPQRTLTCVVHSRFPGLSGRPVRPSRLFFPLSTRVYQAHAEGRGCLPFTREAGVFAIPPSFCGIIDLHGFAVTKVKRLPPPIPCLHKGSFGRTGRIHRLQRTAASPLRVRAASQQRFW